MLQFQPGKHVCLPCQLQHVPQIALPAIIWHCFTSPNTRPFSSASQSLGRARRTKKDKEPPGDSIGLNKENRQRVYLYIRFGPVLRRAAKELGATSPTPEAVTVEQVLNVVEGKKANAKGQFAFAIERLRESYATRGFAELDAVLQRLPPLRRARRIPLQDAEESRLFTELGFKSQSASRDSVPKAPRPKTREPAPKKARGPEKLATLDPLLERHALLKDFRLIPIKVDRPKVPQLSHDLSRVLFNPGVYQLQDPRSRVWNFDPYLGSIMPVSEFNYEALNRYVTSSEDAQLRDVARQYHKRYIGSTSSMSGTLSHFHFLLSSWRDLTMDTLSRGFKDDGASFTRLSRGPTAIFLRYKDGVYAVDADKEFDSANILMSLGRSMEKLLTLDRDEFERYRKTHDAEKDSQMPSMEPEAYHYSEVGQFLLRSQLDAYDPRLPGTGMFDLKTRAVAAVRMMMENHETAVGYQIKGVYGTWESFEREYHDMMRSAFLKYSLQVRMGRMDGIFVAYHNTERLFGFQYMPLSEMDLALHGQTDRTLGDQEFRLSINLLTEIFNEATAKHPEQSLRFHFEAREATSVQPPHMYIFVEPVSEDEIVDIQNSKKMEIEAYERRIFSSKHRAACADAAGDPGALEPNMWPVDAGRVFDGAADSNFSPLRSALRAPEQPSASVLPPSGPATVGPSSDLNPADDKDADSPQEKSVKESATGKTDDKTSQLPSEPSPHTSGKTTLLAWKLNVLNLVNGCPVVRPQNHTTEDTWSVKYTLTPLSEGLAQRNYALCKARRRSILDTPQKQDAAVGFYIQNLVSMSRRGAEWRRKMDESDAKRDPVVLYGK